MKSIIEEIYFGKRGFAETIKTNDNYWKVHEEVGVFYEKLLNELSDEQKSTLDKMYSVIGGLEAEQSVEHFKEGFKLGLLIAVEAFLGD